MMEDEQNDPEAMDEPVAVRHPETVTIYGCMTDRRNRLRRMQQVGRVPRQVRLGKDRKTVVRRGRRITVPFSFFVENIGQIKEAYEAGLIWIEKGPRQRVSDLEMKAAFDHFLDGQSVPVQADEDLDPDEVQENPQLEGDPDEDDGDEEDDETDEDETEMDTEGLEPVEPVTEVVTEPEPVVEPVTVVEEPVKAPYAEWDYNDLKKEVAHRGLETKDLKKDTLVEALEASDKG